MPPMTDEDYAHYTTHHLRYLISQHDVSTPSKDRTRQQLLIQVVELNLNQKHVERFWDNDIEFEAWIRKTKDVRKSVKTNDMNGV